MKKKLLIIMICLLTLSGCTNITNQNLDNVISTFLTKDMNLSNNVFQGYKYYIPKGLKLISKDEYNALLKDENQNNYYFYIDVVSYYNKTKLNYTTNSSSYYSKQLNYHDKEGYVEITKAENSDYYFVEYMYNYGKIEAFIKENDLKSAIINMSNVLSSLKFNRNILATTIGNKTLNYKEDTYNVMKPKGSKATKDTYLNYEEKYGVYEGYSNKKKDEDKIEIDKD